MKNILSHLEGERNSVIIILYICLLFVVGILFVSKLGDDKMAGILSNIYSNILWAFGIIGLISLAVLVVSVCIWVYNKINEPPCIF